MLTIIQPTQGGPQRPQQTQDAPLEGVWVLLIVAMIFGVLTLRRRKKPDA